MERRRSPRLWRVLRDHPDLLDLDVRWRAQLGEDHGLCQPLLAITRQRAERWPCGEVGRLGCSRIIVEHGPGDIVAVCGGSERRCPTISISKSERVLHRLDWQELAQRVGGELGVDLEDIGLVGGQSLAGWHRGALVRLGVASFGRSQIECYLVRHDADEGFAAAMFEARERAQEGVRVLFLLPATVGLPVPLRDICGRLDIDLLALEDVAGWTPSRELVLDLGEYVYRHRLDVPDPSRWLWPRYSLILDPVGGRYWYRGERLQFARSATFPQAFIERLAEEPGVFVNRRKLARHIWPEDYPRGGGEYVAWDRKVRGHKKKVDDLLKSVGGESIIEAVSSGKDGEGGYRLLLNPGDIARWSVLEDRKM